MFHRAEYRSTSYEKGEVQFHLAVEDDLFVCPICKSCHVIRKGGRERSLQTVPIGMKAVFLVTEVPKCECKDCGAKFEISPHFASAYVHYTEKLAAYANVLSRLMTISDAAELSGLSWDTVKDIVKQRLKKDYEHIPFKGLKTLSIDEIYVGRKKKFYTLVLDLESGRIVWVCRGRGKAALQGFWRRLRKCKAKIQAVAMDMSGAYWAAVLEALPKVKVVFDRFHIIKLMNEKLDDLRRDMVREAEGPLKMEIKGTRYLLLSRMDNLKDDQLPKLEKALKLNEPLFAAWFLKEELTLLWEQTSFKAMEHFLRQWCARAMDTGIQQLAQMAKTLLTHWTGILNWWVNPINNGKMEGTNNKIKTLTRQAYGYRDEDFFILKLLGLHESRYKLVG